MIDFFREGGFAMFLILALGGFALFLAGSHAIRPRERKLSLIRPLSLATVFASLTGLCAGLAMTTKFIAKRPDIAASGETAKYVLIGTGESLSNPILGFSLLTLVWLLVTIGQRRTT